MIFIKEEQLLTITVVGCILNHASGNPVSWLNITTEINQSNCSTEDISDAPWLSEDDILDNETSNCDDEIEMEDLFSPNKQMPEIFKMIQILFITGTSHFFH